MLFAGRIFCMTFKSLKKVTGKGLPWSQIYVEYTEKVVSQSVVMRSQFNFSKTFPDFKMPKQAWFFSNIDALLGTQCVFHMTKMLSTLF